MTTGKIVPFGYAAGGVPELERLMADGAYLVDIRLSPRSHWPVFNQDRLKARFHKRYIHMPELGNLNYSNRGQSIKIADPDRGIQRLINGLNQGYTLILMCGCKQYETCHRHTVIDLLLGSMPEAQIVMPDVTAPADTLKCLSIRQPWAWLILGGHKDIENRDWTTSYRGPVLIHAGAVIDNEWFNHRTGCPTNAHPMRDLAPDDMPARHDYPIKSIVGMATLADVVEHSTSQWFVGRYGFVIRDARPFEKPIPYSGSLKLFDVDREVVAHEVSSHV